MSEEQGTKEGTMPTFSWAQLGLELLRAIATASEDEHAAETASISQPVASESRVFAHYVAYNGQRLVALVIGQDEERGFKRADLAVFTNMKNAAGKKNFGLQFHQDVTYSEMNVPGTWHYLD